MRKLNLLILELPANLVKDKVIKRILKISLFLFLTILGSKVEIPVEPVPFTLQTLFVILSGAFLGKKDGFIVQISYLFLGAIGIPVFAGPISGVARLFGPTGGYLLSFPIAAFISGYFFKKENSLRRISLGVILSIFTIYLFGILHLNFFYLHNLKSALLSGAAIFSFWEIVKMIAAVAIYKKIAR